MTVKQELEAFGRSGYPVAIGPHGLIVFNSRGTVIAKAPRLPLGLGRVKAAVKMDQAAAEAWLHRDREC